VVEVTSGREMAGRHLRNRSIVFGEDSIVHRDSKDVDQINSLDNTAVNQRAETEGIVMSECEGNNTDSIVTTEVGVGMSARQLQDLLTNALSTLRTDIVTMIDSKLQAATENITAKIRQENEKLSEKLTQNLHNEVQKLSSDICTLRNDTESKFQEVTRTIGSVTDSLNERIHAHVVATRKLTDRISQETNGRAGHLFDSIKVYKTEAENSLKEFRQDYSQFREQMSLEQATWQNKAAGEMDKVKDSVRLVEGRVTEVQTAAQNSIQKLNTEITYLRERLAARQLTGSAIPSQVLPVTAVDVENCSQLNSELATSVGTTTWAIVMLIIVVRLCVTTLHHNQMLL